jgi:mRNA interferase MazF
MTKALQRGEVWLVDLGLAAKTRPALVLSIAVEDQDRSIVTVVPHTTSIRSSRFEVAASTRFLKTGVFDCQNLITIPHAKLVKRLGELSSSEMSAIENSVRQWLGLRP